MQFFKSLYPPLLVWQLLSLSPFKLDDKTLMPTHSRASNALSIASILIQCSVLVFGICEKKYYISYGQRSSMLAVADFVSMSLIRCASILIVLDSFIKRHLQVTFLKNISEIDSILNGKLLIDLHYPTQYKRNLLRFVLFVACYLFVELSMEVRNYCVGGSVFNIYWTFYTIPMFMCMLRYQQFTTYVYLLHDRYHAINEFIKKLVVRPRNTQRTNNLPQFVWARSFHWHRGQEQNLHLINKLKHVQQSYRLLISANNILCRIFNWSMLLNLINDFFNVLMNSYWLISNIIRGEAKLSLIVAFPWAFFNIMMIILLSKACHLTSHEVTYISDDFKLPNDLNLVYF